MSKRMPAIFLGHGNPMNAILRNKYTQEWAALGQALPKPRAIVAVSAHWYAPGVRVTAMERPRTIHDFGGFPEELFQFQYPAPGDPELAQRVQQLLAPLPVTLDETWGLDHGTWSMLCHLFAKADVPVIQLSIDECQAGLFHYELGQKLAALRDEGVLILGSGNLVHNLHAYSWGRHQQEPYDWALRFEQTARQLITERNHQPLIHYESLGKDAQLSVPTPEHFLPLLYILALHQKTEPITFLTEGIDGGSISMLGVKIG